MRNKTSHNHRRWILLPASTIVVFWILLAGGCIFYVVHLHQVRMQAYRAAHPKPTTAETSSQPWAIISDQQWERGEVARTTRDANDIDKVLIVMGICLILAVLSYYLVNIILYALGWMIFCLPARMKGRSKRRRRPQFEIIEEYEPPIDMLVEGYK